jgi:hypothetical protein
MAINSPKTALDLVPGDSISFSAGGMILNPIIQSNNPNSFSWQGSFIGILTGKHYFQFIEGDSPNETLFVQSEEMSGLFGFLFAAWWPVWLGNMRGKTLAMFETFNGDLKRRVIEG